MDIDILTTDIVHISMCDSIHATNGNWYCMLTKADVGGTRSITALHISQLLDWLQAGEGVFKYSSRTTFTKYLFHIFMLQNTIGGLFKFSSSENNRGLKSEIKREALHELQLGR